MTPITLEIYANLFCSLAEEMGALLCRAALSPNIKERRDYSCLVCDRDGELIAQAAHIPVHLGSAPFAVKHAIRKMKLRRGDIALFNDPYLGGTHLPDLSMAAPVYLPGDADEPSFYLANRAHHSDVGGMSPGSMPVSREIFQEGLILPPVKIMKAGAWDEELLDVLLANVRTPRERLGDLKAQVGSLQMGIARFQELAETHDADVMRDFARKLVVYAETAVRAAISGIPDGEYRAEDYLDEYESEGRAKIVVRVRISGDSAEFNFTGSSPQTAGNLNTVEAVTISAALYVLRLLLPKDVLFNAGTLKPLKVILPERSIVNCAKPAAVVGGSVETSQRIVDVLLAALAHAMPDRIPAASQGTMNNLAMGSSGGGAEQAFSYYETVGGGAGGGPAGPGASALHTHMTNTLNTPIEALEAEYPLRVEFMRVRRGSGGAGLRPGGDGMERAIRVLRPASVSILSERRDCAPYGLAGGLPGKTGENELIAEDGRRTRLPGKCSFQARPGDIVVIRTPGGGGWGAPDDDEKD